MSNIYVLTSEIPRPRYKQNDWLYRDPLTSYLDYSFIHKVLIPDQIYKSKKVFEYKNTKLKINKL